MSDSLIKYNPYYTVSPFGLNNTGVICYFNSMLQCLISCTSVLEKFDTTPGLQTRNALCAAFWKLITTARTNPADAHSMSPVVWSALITRMKASGKTFKNFGSGQEDVNEGLTLFVDELDAPEIEQLFEHRYRTVITCGKCGNKHKIAADNIITGDIKLCTTFHFDEVKKAGGDLQQMIIKQSRDDLDGFACAVCKDRSPKTESVRLSMTPEILVITLKKYDGKWAIDAPETITIPSNGDSPFQYRLVALSDHSGGQSGGHYWAHARRADDKCYVLNDTNVSPINRLQSSLATYMIWYHAV